MEKGHVKRFIGTIVAFVMAVIFIPHTAEHVEAATKVTDYCKVEYDNTASVSSGTVRYVSQILGRGNAS